MIHVKKRTITLNCDMGESFGHWSMGNDELVMPWVDMANIACGFHASDPHVMSRTIDFAIQHDVQIGAHPGYPDLQGFGRRSMSFTEEEICEILIYQIGALKALCESKNTDVSYVKPHGALYNDMMANEDVFRAVADAVSCFNIPLMILASGNNQRYLDIADNYDVPLLFEAFADRTYLANGQLTPRSMPNAVLTSEDTILSQIKQIAEYGRVSTSDGVIIPIEADTICVHGDNDAAIELIAKIRAQLDA
uniref:5-oxoprolinase subunit A n=1 Tax=Vibrio ziniensis TaxID=2711221 RepID=A0A6G7CPX1_9VIBR|nr:LamB/YcsF family protein [Vibrio ziniensis]